MHTRLQLITPPITRLPRTPRDIARRSHTLRLLARREAQNIAVVDCAGSTAAACDATVAPDYPSRRGGRGEVVEVGDYGGGVGEPCVHLCVGHGVDVAGLAVLVMRR